jgi:hypothetical protein
VNGANEPSSESLAELQTAATNGRVTRVSPDEKKLRWTRCNISFSQGFFKEYPEELPRFFFIHEHQTFNFIGCLPPKADFR